MLKKNKTNEDLLFNNILLLSRNKIFFTKFNLKDTFENRINLIFIHISFIFIKFKNKRDNNNKNSFYQKLFDVVFKKIEINMREIGYGDVVVNKNMRYLLKVFYNILLNIENFSKNTTNINKRFFLEHLKHENNDKNLNILPLIQYFEKYQAFCLDLTHDSVLKGDLNFIYR